MDPGVYPWGQLLDHYGRRALEKMIRKKRLIWTRRGWYRKPTAHPKVIEAVTRGGVLGCADALAWHNVWVSEAALRQRHIRANKSNNTKHPGRYCKQYGPCEPESGAVDEIPIALRHAARCLSDEDFIIVCDSVLNKRLMTPSELAAEFADAPARVIHLLSQVDGRADSGLETMVRLRLRAKRIHVEVQHVIDNVGRVDLLVGDCLIIETDGDSHLGRQAGRRDRLRDRHSLVGKYRVIRLTYEDVVFHWEEAEADILAVIRRGDHKFTKIRSDK